MGYNVLSGKIKVFPTSKSRAENDISANKLYEYNIANIIRQLIDKDGFVISGGIENSSNSGLIISGSPLKFNIHGYYFEIEVGTTIYESSTSILYACIKIDESQLSGQDNDEGMYTGVVFMEEPEEDYYSLKVWENDAIPEDSKVKFSSESLNLEISGIDGKRNYPKING